MPTKWACPLCRWASLYGASAWKRLGNVRIHFRSPVERIDEAGFRGGRRTCATADYYICALPFERLEAVGLAAPKFEHSPITGVHLWFDREITTLPHATLLDRTMQWMFNKDRRPLSATGGERVARSDRISRATRSSTSPSATCACTFPRVQEAQLVKAHVIKEQRATFSAAPETESLRPDAANAALPNVFLAGDWTRTGWPATMEGAVRSGYLAAEAVARAAGRPARFVVPDMA